MKKETLGFRLPRRPVGRGHEVLMAPDPLGDVREALGAVFDSLEIAVEPHQRDVLERRHTLERQTLEGINTICRRDGATIFTTLLATLAITLRKWTAQEDLVIGTVVAGRNSREVENLIGCFINFLPLRINASESASGRDILRQARNATHRCLHGI